MTAVVRTSNSNATQAPAKPTFELIYDADRNISGPKAKDLAACFENGIRHSVTGWKTKDTRPISWKFWVKPNAPDPKLVQIFKINNPEDRVDAFNALRTRDNRLAKSSLIDGVELDRGKRQVWFGTCCRNKSCRPAQGQFFRRQDNPAHFAHTHAKCPFRTMIQSGLEDRLSISDCSVNRWFGQSAHVASEDRYKLKNILLCDLQPGRIYKGPDRAQPCIPHEIYDIYRDQETDTLYVENNKRVLPRYLFRYEQVQADQ